jgi:hypothetical protein
MAVLQVDLPRLRCTVQVPGRPVWPDRQPYQVLSVRAHGDGWLMCASAPGSDDPDLVGDLVVPCELPGGGFESVLIGRLPLPRPFGHEDLAALRVASDELRVIMTMEAVAEGRLGLTEHAIRAGSREGFDVRALVDLGWAVAALRQWPLRRSRRVGRYPPEIIRGLTDEPETFREAAAGRIAIVDGQPDKSVRHLVAPAPWTSARIAGLCYDVATELEDARVAERLAEELRHVAAVSTPRGRRPDAARSTWPRKFHLVWDAGLALLTAPRRAPGAGDEHQPLQPAWSMYQDWVTVEVVRAIDTALGPFRRGGVSTDMRLRPGGESPLLGWATNEWVFDLWVTPAIGSAGAPRHIKDIYAAGLAPDILIVRRARSHIGELGDCPPAALKTIVLDAKRYSGRSDSPGVLSAGTAASEASKYLWALRSPHDNHRHQVDGVVLVSPGGGPVFVDTARTSVVGACPGRSAALVDLINSFVNGP